MTLKIAAPSAWATVLCWTTGTCASCDSCVFWCSDVSGSMVDLLADKHILFKGLELWIDVDQGCRA